MTTDRAHSAPYKRRTADNGFVARHAHWWLGLMLLALHAGVAWGIDTPWGPAFLLVHFGLFLLWQPLWRGEGEIESRNAFLVIIVGLLLSALSNWWLIALWLAVLTGLIGGSLPGMGGRRQRFVSFLAALFFLSLLLMWVVPNLSGNYPVDTWTTLLVRYGLPAMPVMILFLRIDPPRAEARVAVDLFYSLMLFLLVAALVLGSVVIMQMNQGQYAVALAQTLMVIALVLVGLSWLWNPTAGFSGIEQLLSRYLLSVGLPFEQWVQELATLAEREIDPRRFLNAALDHILALSWITGLRWETPAGSGQRGQLAEHFAEFNQGGLSLRIHARWTLSPAMLLHLKLLAQMVGHFYAAKEREQLQRQNAYTQAIYETGSRLTHDVKNLLQSLRSLCAAAESSAPDQSGELQALMQRQLPQITQRLNTTLDKLRAPDRTDTHLMRAAAWWQAIQQRYAHRSVTFICDGDFAGHEVPSEMFDSVADNLIDNALRKQLPAGGRVAVSFVPATTTLQVTDTGEPIPKELAGELFAAPVTSRSGLGVGLYHAAKHAAQVNYALTLADNREGSVIFRLSPMLP
ncbi:MAG: ATP-binding protein [Burkholderiales bacterium]